MKTVIYFATLNELTVLGKFIIGLNYQKKSNLILFHFEILSQNLTCKWISVDKNNSKMIMLG